MIKHSKYFDDNVQSLGFNSENGYATVGVMKPGNYIFNTEVHEKMVITSGSVEVKIPGEEQIEVQSGNFFEVEAHQSFEIFVKSDVTYICYYG